MVQLIITASFSEFVKDSEGEDSRIVVEYASQETEMHLVSVFHWSHSCFSR